MSVRGRRGDDTSDNNHVGAVVPEEREEHGYRSVRFRHNIINTYTIYRYLRVLIRIMYYVRFKGFCLAVRMLGSAATYIIGPNVVSVVNGGPLKPFIMRSQIMHMLYACKET